MKKPGGASQLRASRMARKAFLILAYPKRNQISIFYALHVIVSMVHNKAMPSAT